MIAVLMDRLLTWLLREDCSLCHSAGLVRMAGGGWMVCPSCEAGDQA